MIPQQHNAHILRTINHFIRKAATYGTASLTKGERRTYRKCYDALEQDVKARNPSPNLVDAVTEIASLQNTELVDPTSKIGPLNWSRIKYVQVTSEGEIICTDATPTAVWRWAPPQSKVAIDPYRPRYHFEHYPTHSRPLMCKIDATQSIPVVSLTDTLNLPCQCFVIVEMALDDNEVPVNTVTFSRN